MEIKFLFWGLILLLNTVRFLGLDFSPPGFYVDEAVGAAQVLCIKETGSDFFHQSYPLFSAGLGAGYYTAPYLYGEMLFTAIFGNSIYVFRAFLAFITFLTIGLIYIWTKRETNERTARFALLFASLSPWAFQFSRIAWDPPLAPFFLMLGLVLFQSKRKWSFVLGALAFAFASYAYPPARIQALIFLIFIPNLNWKKTITSIGIWFLALIPLFYRSLDPNFTARARMLVLWSDYPMNPYHDANFFGLLMGFVTEFMKFFSPSFLVGSGDHNYRHSIQSFGMLSYVEAAVLFLGLIYFLFQIKRWKNLIPQSEQGFLFLILIGLFTGLAPGALTWEGGPHALRAIGAWPFFTLLSAWLATRLTEKKEYLSWFIYGGSVLFASFYFYSYFTVYPVIAEPWFKTEPAPVAQAYQQMVGQGISCSSLKR